MKRCWFGGALLLVLLLGGLLVTGGMTRTHEAIAGELKQAARAAEEENWQLSAEKIRSAGDKWEKKWRFSAAFADHEPMEEIDGLFAQLEVYQHMQDPEALAAVCAQLSRLVEAIGEAHALNWWNLL